jgi:hypothetical protein
MSDDLSERLRQHGNYLYGIGNAGTPMTAADFLAAGARIDRLQAELDIARGQLLSNERGDDRRHYVCVCPDCTKPVDTKSNDDGDALTVAYMAGVAHEKRRGEAQRGGAFIGWWEHERNDNANEKHYALKGWCAGVLACARKPLDFKQSQIVASAAHIDYCLNKHSSYEMALIRGTERAHGIEEEKANAP